LQEKREQRQQDVNKREQIAIKNYTKRHLSFENIRKKQGKSFYFHLFVLPLHRITTKG
jgi:hypothetical protein